MTTLIIDIGQDIIGIFLVGGEGYFPYRGAAKKSAIRLIRLADEVVTYNGSHYDLKQLGKFAGEQGSLSINGTHVDLRSICWSDRIYGSSLDSTYNYHFTDCPVFSDTYEGANERDVYMTFKLWELWKHGILKILDGQTLA
jgi:hypothetical protein